MYGIWDNVQHIWGWVDGKIDVSLQAGKYKLKGSGKLVQRCENHAELYVTKSIDWENTPMVAGVCQS